MSFHKHCNLCDNVKTSLQDGMTCGLTDKKPAFNKTCPKIKLGEKFEKQLGLIHIDIEELKKRKTSVYIYSSLYLIIGCMLILSQKKLFIDDFNLTYSDYLRLTRPFLIVLLGFGLSTLAYSRLNQYRKKTKIVKDRKDRIDAVLNKYQIEYSCSVEFGEEYHGNQDINVELKSNSSLLKDSKSTFQI